VIFLVLLRVVGKDMVCIALHEVASNRLHRINCILSGEISAAVYIEAVFSLCETTKKLVVLFTLISGRDIIVPLPDKDIHDMFSVKDGEFLLHNLSLV
jgi:hypothetical protein